ncbi:hypothetical protein E4U43_007370 [Claviceps pusilla]|uniref:F-box domain-containing protein n=1 Tax=Claviceps pusilla TaxID=123648 RepID=A0A9P7NEK5_9HYPO|nr:hypothetical protein E4U43_007370 [Claviceps pusilla]
MNSKANMKRLWAKLRRWVRLPRKRGASPKAPPAPATEQECPRAAPRIHGRNSMLENLPPELHRVLLSTLDIEELRNLVFASPVIYRQYLLDRRYLLCKCLDVTLGPVVVDAHAVHLASENSPLASLRGTGMLNIETIERFLSFYHARRVATPQPSFFNLVTEEEAVSICRFHLTVIDPILRLYVSWALGNLASETKAQPDSQPLSPAEKSRLLRGLYRFELCCALYGPRFNENDESQLSWQEIRFHFLDYSILDELEPWEAEEVRCFHAFAKDKYAQIFNSIAWDVDSDNPKFLTPFDKGVFDLREICIDREQHSEAVISRGLKFMLTTLSISKHAVLVSTMQDNIFFKLAFFEDPVIGRYHIDDFPVTKHQLAVRRAPLPFVGDIVDSASGTWTPPFLWTRLWRETYSNINGWLRQESIQRWGYVFWDASRVERTGAEEVMKRQSKMNLDYYDPRGYEEDEEDWGYDPAETVLYHQAQERRQRWSRAELV